MSRILFLIVFFFIPIQFVFSDSADSLKWIEMPVKTYPDYPVLINYIDSSYFNRHKKNYLSYASSVPIVKKKRTIKVKCANKTYKFKDSRNEDEQKYYVAGSYKSWIIIKGYLYYHFEQYYMINPKTGEIDSLAGEPLFYDDKILCIEGDNTDGTKMIEVWQIDDDTISLRYSADLKRRRIYDINDFYLFDDTIFLKLEERYLKMYYAKPTRVSSTYQGLQPFKYNAKELDRVHGLDWYDYGARMYDPAFCQFTQIDPLCEQYPHLSPYAYCAGNPVNAIDPDGKLVIFINGFHNGFQGASPKYWGGFDTAVLSGVKIAEYDFAPFEPFFQFAVLGVDTYQYSHVLDPIARFFPVWGANMMSTGFTLNIEHSIDSFTKYITTLPEGRYMFVNGEHIKIQENE